MNNTPCYETVEYFPPSHWTWNHTQVSFIRVFNSDYQELSYTMPSVTDVPVVFTKPRIWSDHLLSTLSFRSII